MKPFFSIILPTYNQGNFLKICLESILNQTYRDWELIIVDNNSTDNTQNVINKMRDERFHVLKINNQNILAKSRNIGIKKAKTDWICFIDSDDTWYPKKLEIVKNYIYENKNENLFYHDLVFLNKYFFFKKKKIYDKSQTITKPVFNYFAENGNGIGQSSVVVKKNLLKENGYISMNKEKFSWEDFDTWLKISKKTNSFKRIPITLGSIWIGKENISNLEKQIQNSDNIKKYYGKSFAKVLKNINDKSPWWLEYPKILRDFKNKNNQECLEKINLITKPPFKVNMIINYFKFKIYLRILKNKIKKIFNIVIIFEKQKTEKHRTLSKKYSYKVIKNSKQLKNETFTNFILPQYFFNRLKNKKKLHILTKKNNLLSYGWSSSSNDFQISEINCSIKANKKIIFFDFKTIIPFRRKGFYKLILNLMTKYFQDYDCYIFTNLNNFKSFLGIKRANFKIIKILTILSNNYKID